MNNYVRRHNFGYGTNADKHTDGNINKLELRNISDLTSYLKELIQRQVFLSKVKDNVVFTTACPYIKLRIKKIK